MTAEEIIEDILEREGENKRPGYLAPNDRGGRTNWGISEKAHPEEWANGKIPNRDRARIVLTKVYHEPFINITNIMVKAQLVDWAVLHGEPRTRRWVGRMIANRRDATPANNHTINAAEASCAFFNDALVAWRLKLIDEISDADISQKANEEGWENRALSFLELV